jgi:hypothetical protein
MSYSRGTFVVVARGQKKGDRVIDPPILEYAMSVGVVARQKVRCGVLNQECDLGLSLCPNDDLNIREFRMVVKEKSAT